MPKVVSATDAKSKFGSLVNWVVENGDEVIVENHGQPTVVMIPLSEYENYRTYREAEKRKKVFARLRELRDRVRTYNQDIITDEQALEIADEIVREAINGLVAKGKIRFESEQPE